MAIGPGNLRERHLKKLEEIIDKKIEENQYDFKINMNCRYLPEWKCCADDIIDIYKTAGWSKVYFYDNDYNVFLVLER